MSNLLFSQLFKQKEFDQLVGPKYAAIKRLTSLLFFTLTALGFAIGGMKQLSKRMNNPFTSWVDLSVSTKVEKKMRELSHYQMTPDTMAKYHIGSSTTWNKYFLTFYHHDFNPLVHRKDSLNYIRTGRTIDFAEELFSKIIEKENLIYLDSSAFGSDGIVQEECGIVVTKALIERLGYEISQISEVRYLLVSVNQGRDKMFVRIIGVVEHLPSLCQFVSSNVLFGIMQGEYGNMIKSNNDGDSCTLRLLSGQPEMSQQVAETLLKVLGKTNYDFQSERIQIRKDLAFYANVIRFSPDQCPNEMLYRELRNELLASGEYCDYSYFQCGSDAGTITNPHYITFGFSKLSKIRSFQKQLYQAYDIEIPMEQIEARENFRLVSKLTTILGITLYGLGLVGVLLFLGNLVSNHIRKIKPSLGTFKAMGLSNQVLISSYIDVIRRLLLTSLSIAAICSLVVGYILDDMLLGVGFDLFNLAVFFGVLIIYVVVFLIVRSILKETLHSTPGDLIYERDQV